ncbi:hypothetical protein SLE2022_296030 [Rubroshorea leprosula]
MRWRALFKAKKAQLHLWERNKNNTQIKNYVALEKLAAAYIASGEVELARHLFDTIPKPHVACWDLLIRTYAWNGPFEQAISMYRKMLESGVTPSKFTFPFVLKACSSMQAIEDGRMLHDHAVKLGLHSDLYVCTALIDLYAKCGNLILAQRVFNSMSSKDVVAWNATIAGFSLHGVYDYTLQLFLEMQRAGARPNSSTIVSLLPTMAQANALGQGKAMHGFCVRRDFHNDVVVGTGLLDMYAKCRCISSSRRIFDTMGIKNVVTWTAMIGACVTCDLMGEALELFNQMVLKGSVNPTPATIVSVLRACAGLTDLTRGRCFHSYTIKSGYFLDMMVANTLLSLYAKCSIIDDAIRFFSEMRFRDTISYNAIISGCIQNGFAIDALLISREMYSSGVYPDSTTLVSILAACSHLAALDQGTCGHCYSVVHDFIADTSICNALINMYSKCGKVDIARKVFDRMQRRDVVSWNAIIAGYGIHGLGTEAITLFHDMQVAGIEPDDVTFICLLSACSHSGLVNEGKHWFNAMSTDFKISPRMDHYTCMVDLMARAGLLEETYKFIEEMPFEPSINVWVALLAACRLNKNIKLGEEVSKKIQRLGPEGTTNFILLSDMYKTLGRWEDAEKIRIMQRNQRLRKSPGCSWIEINGVTRAIPGSDQLSPQGTNALQVANAKVELGMHMF